MHALAVLILVLALVGCAQPKPQTQPNQSPPAAPQAQQGQPAAAGAAAAGAPAAVKPLIATSPDGMRIAYEVAGSGPVLMMLHGGGQTRRSWNELGYVDRLAKTFKVVTLDLRGNGDSGKPATFEAYALDRVVADVLAVADAAGAKRFHLYGFGHGASIGRYLAARSDRVISAALVSANMGPTVTGVVKDAIAGMRAKWQPLVDAQQAGTLDVAALSPGDRSAWQAGVAATAMALAALAEYPPLEPADIKAPTLWVVGAGDASAMENVKAYEGKLAGTQVKLEQLSGATYSESFVRVDAVLGAVEPFFASTAATP